MNNDNILTHFSLFSGIGGIDLAAEWAGFETVGQCEIDDYATRVLEKNFPNVPRWRDIRDVTTESFRERTGLQSLTLLSGGFPCQPHSLAGKRKASADERDLWSEFARVIREIRPKWVLGENVRGLLSSESGRFFGRILRDLDEMGYNVGWCCYGADRVGACHRRERVFIIAWNSNGDNERKEQSIFRRTHTEPAGICTAASDTHSEWELQQKRAVENIGEWVGNGSETVADTESAGLPNGEVRQGEIEFRRDHSRNIWEEWTTEPPICGMGDGIPHRVDRLRCLGNAVVPQQVHPILEAIAEIEKDKAHGESGQKLKGINYETKIRKSP